MTWVTSDTGSFESVASLGLPSGIPFAGRAPHFNGATHMAAPPPAGPGHNSGAAGPQPTAPKMTKDERLRYLHDQIALFIGKQRRETSLTPHDLGKQADLGRLKVLRNGLLVAAARHCRLNPLADTRVPILMFITFLADNEDGICRLSVTRMCQIFGRSRETITSSIEGLEKDGQIGVTRKHGAPNCYWPLVPAAFAALDANTTWLVDALSTGKRKWSTLPDQLSNQSTLPDQSDWSTLPDQLGGEVVKDRRQSGQGSSSRISLKNSLEDSLSPDGEGVDASLFSDEAPSEEAPPPSKGTPCKPKKPTKVSDADVDAAFDAYNEAADQYGLTRCSARTDDRRKQLAKRLADIGGLDEFRRALSALPRDDWLMGRISKSFKLKIDQLLSTKSGMGDVLGRLLDAAGDAPAGNSQRTFNDDLKQFAASQTGKDILARAPSPEKGWESLRRIVADNRRRNGLDA